jgi:hypothetical protein
MSSVAITPAVAKAMRRLYQILEDNFDPEAGQYLEGYSDERVAKECEISLEAVKHHRTSAFGKLKPPNELALLQREVDELQKFALQTEGDMRAKIKELNNKLIQFQKRYS